MESIDSVIDDMYRALSAGARDWFEERVVRDSSARFVGLGYWMDAAEFRAALYRRFEEITITWRPGHRIVDARPDAAWVLDHPLAEFDDGSILEPRLTLVFVGSGDRWLLAHSHLSASD